MEKPDYRANLSMLSERFPDRVGLSPKEVAELLDADVETIRSATRKKYNPLPSQKLSERKVIIPIAGLARWLCGK